MTLQCDYHRRHKPGEREPTCQGPILRISIPSKLPHLPPGGWYACETMRCYLREAGFEFEEET